MSLSTREKMKIVGVTLNDVANDCKLSVSDVCRLLNDDLVKSVKTSADNLVLKKREVMEKKLSGK
tara:strand:+ start:81 stop:275 length:195 start_codon:yes stop_codon:yes gene_type:complete